jgi:hypothetical protein
MISHRPHGGEVAGYRQTDRSGSEPHTRLEGRVTKCSFGPVQRVFRPRPTQESTLGGARARLGPWRSESRTGR